MFHFNRMVTEFVFADLIGAGLELTENLRGVIK